MEDVAGCKFNPPTQFHPNPPMYLTAAWQKLQFWAFLGMGMAADHAHPAHLLENVPEGNFNPPTQFHPNPLMYLAAAWQNV